MENRKPNNDTVFHERISILRDRGYRGFKVSGIRKEWDGVLVTATNTGKIVSASGETTEEAYEKLIDKIDLTLEIT